jgi:hypothetical protein
MRATVLGGLLLAVLSFGTGCSDQPTSPREHDPGPLTATASLAGTTQQFVTRNGFAAADYFIQPEIGCELTEIFIVGGQQARLEGGTRNFGDFVFVALDEFDNCTLTEGYWTGVASSGYTQKGLTSASLSTPITLTNAETGETRTFTVNLKWKGTTEQYTDPGHYNSLDEGQRLLIHYNYVTRVANVTTAQLIDASGTNLLDDPDAILAFANISNSSEGSITITYP